jgi:hypothetical protein
MIISSLLFAINFKFSKHILGAILLFNLIYMTPKMYAKLTFNPITNLDLAKSEDLVKAFDNINNKDINILISPRTPFEFEKNGLNPSQIHYIWTPLARKYIIEKDWNSAYSKYKVFKEKDFIVINKNDFYFNVEALKSRNNEIEFKEALKIIDNFNKSGNLGYEKFKVTKYFYIWRKRKLNYQ